ncbi:MAG: CPBP family intramembrane metalloprotease [Clostridia bacterium]|nr:CPBP family intramembrane metalloprotease [Clostridia bacterium]
MKKKLTVTGANIVFLIVVAVLISLEIVLAIVSWIMDIDLINQNMYFVLLITQFGGIFTTVLIYTLIKGINIKEDFRLKKPGVLPCIWIVLLVIPAQFVASMINYIVALLLSLLGDIPPSPLPIPQNIEELIIGIAVIGIAPAICEEFLHRGLLLRAYEKRGTVKAVVITAVFFGLFHFDLTNLLGATFFGLLIGYYVIRTNSIFAGVLAHFLNNAFVEVQQYLDAIDHPVFESIYKISGDAGYVFVLGTISTVVMLPLLKLFHFSTKDQYVLKRPISTVKKDMVSIFSHWPIIVVCTFYVFITGITILSILFSTAG